MTLKLLHFNCRTRPLQHNSSCSETLVASCSVLQCVAVYLSVLQCVAVCCSVLHWDTCRLSHDSTLQKSPHILTHCNTLQHNSTHCNSPPFRLSHTPRATHEQEQLQWDAHRLGHDSFLQASLQHTATHCNALQHTSISTAARAPCNTRAMAVAVRRSSSEPCLPNHITTLSVSHSTKASDELRLPRHTYE